MKHLLLAIAIAAAVLMVGCSSAVKLDNVPVEDKAGTTISQDGAEGLGSGVGKGGLSSADLDKAAQQAAILAAPRTVYFDYDSFVIKHEFQPIIETHARYIKADKNLKVAIEGHTDERGGREYNLALGQKRAEIGRAHV